MVQVKENTKERIETNHPPISPIEHGIVLQHIHKTYNPNAGTIHEVLRIDYQVIPLRGIIAIVGWSGSGKTTLLNILSLLDHPDPLTDGRTPTITFNLGQDQYVAAYPGGVVRPVIHHVSGGVKRLFPEDAFRRDIFAYVFQDHLLHPNLNLSYNIKMPMLTNEATITSEKLETLAKGLGVEDHLSKQVAQVSGGQAQRAAILRGMLKNCPIIFGDELTSNIDKENAGIVLDTMKAQLFDPENPKQCFLWVSHDINQLKDHAHDILTIQDGRLKLTPNTFKDDANGILLLLEQDHKHPRKPFTQPEYKPATLAEKLAYYGSYAWNDLFRKRWVPTVDFTVIVLAMCFVVLFLLSILKISYGSSKYLELKLSDPRINSLEVMPAKSGVTELYESHFEYLSNLLGDNVHSVTPVYYARISILDKKRNRYKSLGNGFTYRPDNPLLDYILDSEYPAFVKDTQNFKGLVVQAEELEKMGYPPDTTEVLMKFNEHNDGIENVAPVPILAVDRPLPFGRRMMLRESFYLESYKNLRAEALPPMSFIVVYPKNINDTVAIKNQIEESGELEIDRPFRILNKIKLIEEMKKQVSVFVWLSMFAIVVMSFFFIKITIYRSLHKKRREMGVFKAFGMPGRSLFFFYFIEAAIICIAVGALSLALYHLGVEPLVNRRLAEGGLEGIVNVDNINTTIPWAQLRLPFHWLASTLTLAFATLYALYFYWVRRFSRSKPIHLLKEV